MYLARQSPQDSKLGLVGNVGQYIPVLVLGKGYLPLN
jgi:hypothetical protein